MSLIIDGNHACCDTPYDGEPSITKRMTLCDGARRKPSLARQRELLDEQCNQCLYCERVFGTFAHRNGKGHRLRVEWDHLVPFSFSTSCADREFAAACQICNGIKSATIFKSIEEARASIMLARDEKGWT
jgi:hypothetical protein